MDRKIILLNGPSSSGKSTLSRNLQNYIAEKTGDRYEVVSIDDFMKVSTSETIYEDDVFEISGEMCDKVLELYDSGVGIIIDHVITSERIFNELIDRMAPRVVSKVRITCPLEVLKKREQERGDRCVGSAEASFTYLFPKEGYDLTVDTSAAASERIAQEIFEKLF